MGRDYLFKRKGGCSRVYLCLVSEVVELSLSRQDFMFGSPTWSDLVPAGWELEVRPDHVVEER